MKNILSTHLCNLQIDLSLQVHYKTNMSVYIPVADNRPLRSAIVSHYGNMGIILYPIELKTTNHFIRSHKTILR